MHSCLDQSPPEVHLSSYRPRTSTKPPKSLAADPGLASAAAEELLRFEPTAQMLPPWIVAEELTVSGQTFQPGDLLWTVIAGANRDPEVFDNPDELDFHTLAERYADVTIDPEAAYPVFRPDPMVRGLDALPVILR